MSHLQTAAELKVQCDTGQGCEAYEAFLASEFKHYDAASQQAIATAIGLGAFIGVLLLVIAAAAFIPALKRIVAKLCSLLFVALPIVLIGLVAFGAGFAVSFGACFKQTCSPAEELAPFWAPLLSLVLSVPLTLLVNKRRQTIAAKIEGIRRPIWLTLCCVLIVPAALGTYAQVQSEQAYNATIKNELAEENWVKEKTYNHPGPGQVQCLALTPSCGHCPGTVINKACYIKK